MAVLLSNYVSCIHSCCQAHIIWYHHNPFCICGTKYLWERIMRTVKFTALRILRILCFVQYFYLHAGRSQVWFLMVSLEFFIDIIFLPATVHRAANLTTFMCRLSWNLGASTSWNPQGLSRPVMGELYLYPLYLEWAGRWGRTKKLWDRRSSCN